MDSSTKRTSPLRQRMLDDMRMRKLNEKTQVAYIRAVRQVALHSPDSGFSVLRLRVSV